MVGTGQAWVGTTFGVRWKDDVRDSARVRTLIQIRAGRIGASQRGVKEKRKNSLQL